MAHPRMTHQDLDQLGTTDMCQMRQILDHALQHLIELETTAAIGAAPYEHTSERVTHRHGHRPHRAELEANFLTENRG